MNKETKLANLQKTSKVFAVISRVIEIVNYVGAAICAAAIPVFFIDPDKLKYFVSGQESDQFFQMLSNVMEYKSAMTIFLIVLIVLTLAAAYLFRKIGTVNGVRFSTLDGICKALDCQPGDILEYRAEYNLTRLDQNSKV